MTIRLPPRSLYLSDEDLFRLGNANDPRLDHVREKKDAETYMADGILFVKANGRGISLFSENRIKGLKGWHWMLKAGSSIPPGLVLIDEQNGHYLLCPDRDMSMDNYKGLLNTLKKFCERVGEVK